MRFISINDGYDSESHKGSTVPISVSFGTLIHGHYSKELSVKIRQSYIQKSKKGEFLCGTAPFGYKRSETEKNKLVIDEEAAAVVKEIFNLACKGFKTSTIARFLNYDGIPSPLMYRKKKGLDPKGEKTAINGVSFWTDKNVRKIIYDERYTGIQISGKTTRCKVGSPQYVTVPESKWIKVPDTHKAIVSIETYQKAQTVITRFNISKSGVKRTLFSGKMKCGICGHSLDYSSSKNFFYYCNTARINPDKKCFNGKIYANDIKKMVLTAIQVEIENVLDKRKRNGEIQKKSKKLQQNTVQELKNQTLQCERLRQQMMTLYEHFADGKISKENYLKTKKLSLCKLSEIESRITELNAVLANGNCENSVMDMTTLLKHLAASEDVTVEMAQFINRIIVYDNEHIEIQFNFKDAFK